MKPTNISIDKTVDVLKSEKKQEFISVHESLKPHALKIDLDALNPAAAHTFQIQHNLICPAPAEMSTFDTFAMDDPLPWIAMVVPIVMKAYFTIVRTYMQVHPTNPLNI